MFATYAKLVVTAVIWGGTWVAAGGIYIYNLFFLYGMQHITAGRGALMIAGVLPIQRPARLKEVTA